MGDKYSGMAVASFVLGIFGVIGGNILLFIPSILSIIFGGVGLKRIKESGEKGKGLAIAGLILGILGLLLIPVIIGIVWVVVRNVIESGAAGI